MFQRKKSTTEDRLSAIENKLLDLSGKIEAKQEDITEKKIEVGKLVGAVALDNKPTDVESLSHARKALGRMNETLNDLLDQKSFLEKEKSRLQHELLNVVVRDNPSMMEKEATEFNRILDEAISTMEVLKALHNKLRNHENNFVSLSRERQDALNKLGEIIPLELKSGLGKLAYKGSPYGFSLQLPNNFGGLFLDVVIAYAEKLKNYERQEKINPDFNKPVPQEEEKGFIKILRGGFRA